MKIKIATCNHKQKSMALGPKKKKNNVILSVIVFSAFINGNFYGKFFGSKIKNLAHKLLTCFLLHLSKTGIKNRQKRFWFQQTSVSGRKIPNDSN